MFKATLDFNVAKTAKDILDQLKIGHLILVILYSFISRYCGHIMCITKHYLFAYDFLVISDLCQ